MATLSIVATFADVEKTRKELAIDWYLAKHYEKEAWADLIDSRPKLKHKLEQMRRAFVSFALKVAGSMCLPYCSFEDCGSIGPHSDIDITVVNVRASIMIKIIHSLFEQLFLLPGHLLDKTLDVNLYSGSYYGLVGKALAPLELCESIQDVKTLNDQVLWSMIRLVPAKNKAQRLILSSIDNDTKKKLLKLDKETRKLSLEDHVLGIERVLQRRVDEGDSVELYRDYMRRMSAMHVCENGAYISYGAYKHVVLNLQGGMDLKLSPEDVKASFYDNIAFLSLCEKIDVKAAKYFYRISTLVSLPADLVTRAKKVLEAKKSGHGLKKEIILFEESCPGGIWGLCKVALRGV